MSYRSAAVHGMWNVGQRNEASAGPLDTLEATPAVAVHELHRCADLFQGAAVPLHTTSF